MSLPRDIEIESNFSLKSRTNNPTDNHRAVILYKLIGLDDGSRAGSEKLT